MKRALFLLCLGFVEVVVFLRPSAAALPPRSISTSRQFIVYGSDARLRGAICDLAERTKTSALHLLQEQDEWKTPIIVNAQHSQANHPELPPVHLAFSQTGAGLKLQLDLNLAANANVASVERELLRAVYLEMMYRQQSEIAAGEEFVEPPDWLLDGTLARAHERTDSQISESLRAIATSENIISLADFLHQRPELLEAPWRNVYRAYSAIFVNLLVETPDGRKRLKRFLAELPRSFRDPLDVLRTHFPALGDNVETIEKTWNRRVAQSSPNERFHLLSCAETEEQLAQLLHLQASEPGRADAQYSLEEFPKFVRLPDSANALKSLAPELVALSGHANPLYLPVIFEYEKIALQLARRKTKRMAQRLAEVRAKREQISRTMQTIDDYMNWFEATQSSTNSGVFRDYLQTAERAGLQKAPRRDRISIYLDAIETMAEH